MKISDANITKRKDGRYMGKFITGYDDNGKTQYQYVYGRTYNEAESKVLIGREVASRYLSGRYITVSKIYNEWLNAVVNRVKESTFANYKVKFEKHILPEFADIPCADLSAGRINNFINKKLADGLSASYVRDIFIIFKLMLKYAQEEYGFKLSLKNVVLPKTEKKQIEKISSTEQKRLISYLKANMSLTAFGILIFLFMGLRIGELCGLKWSDVDFENKILYIRRTVQCISSENESRKTKVIISTPKSETSFRSVAVPDFLMKYFEKFRNEVNFFILSDSDKIIEPRTMQYRYKKILKSAEIENHNFHKLRHTFATNCAEKGFNTYV
ncbi:MAG: site-specific integrase [Ruminococcus sp.]|nr:site-specific integrase [Ruminococcus sp.]